MKESLKREIIQTEDGSKTINFPELKESYHSKHGAVNEAKHVFIDTGLSYWLSKNDSTSLSILEIGFGTGLNAFITCLESEKRKQLINYVGVEAYPVSIQESLVMDYPLALSVEDKNPFYLEMHQSSWEEKHSIHPYFKLQKRKQLFEDIQDQNCFDIIYYDAFGARVQPDLWTVDMFKKMYEALKYNGVLVTYSAKGSVRRAMQEVGFKVERLPGPPGKREMLRATKERL